MKKNVIFLMALLCLLNSKMFAQGAEPNTVKNFTQIFDEQFKGNIMYLYFEKQNLQILKTHQPIQTKAGRSDISISHCIRKTCFSITTFY